MLVLPVVPPNVEPNAAVTASGCMSKSKSKEEKSFITNMLDNLWYQIMGSLKMPSLFLNLYHPKINFQS